MVPVLTPERLAQIRAANETSESSAKKEERFFTTEECHREELLLALDAETAKLNEYRALVADLLKSKYAPDGLKAWLKGVSEKIEAEDK